MCWGGLAAALIPPHASSLWIVFFFLSDPSQYPPVERLERLLRECNRWHVPFRKKREKVPSVLIELGLQFSYLCYIYSFNKKQLKTLNNFLSTQIKCRTITFPTSKQQKENVKMGDIKKYKVHLYNGAVTKWIWKIIRVFERLFFFKIHFYLKKMEFDKDIFLS